MFLFNCSVFDVFRTSKCSSSGRLVHVVYGISFMHPYKQSGRWQDVYQAHPAIDQTVYMDAWKKYHKTTGKHVRQTKLTYKTLWRAEGWWRCNFCPIARSEYVVQGLEYFQSIDLRNIQQPSLSMTKKASEITVQVTLMCVERIKLRGVTWKDFIMERENGVYIFKQK